MKMRKLYTSITRQFERLSRSKVKICFQILANLNLRYKAMIKHKETNLILWTGFQSHKSIISKSRLKIEKSNEEE